MLSEIDAGRQRAARTSDRLAQLFGTAQLHDATTSLHSVGVSVASLLAECNVPTSLKHSNSSSPRTPSGVYDQFLPLGFTKTMDRVMKGGIPLGTVAEITGPSGVGKTRLVHHIAAANAVAATLNQEDMDASIPGSDEDSLSSRVLIVDADTTSPNQASSLLTMVQFMVIDRSDQPDHHTAQAIKAIHIMDIREGGNTVKHSTTPHKQTMGAFIKSLYRHLTVHRRCKLIIIDSFTTLLDIIEFPVAPRDDTHSINSNVKIGSGSGSSSSSAQLLDTQTLLQELKQLSEIYRCCVIIVTHASPYSSGPEINRHSGGLTMFHAVNTRMVMQWQATGGLIEGQPTLLPSVNNIKGFQRPESLLVPARVLTVTKSPVCPTPVHFALVSQDSGTGGRGMVHDPTLLATAAPLRTT